MSRLKNKKGFTLIELLAVIVILAIVVVLAFTKIKGFLKKSDKSAAETNAKIFIKGVNDMASLSVREAVRYKTGMYTVKDLIESGNLKINGTLPTGGYVNLERYEVTTACLEINGYAVEFEAGALTKSTLGGSCKLYDPSDPEEVYAYTGSTEMYVVPEDGVYKLQVWGAQGGTVSSTYYGGFGGYSEGIIELKKNDLLYINVGGAGTASKDNYNIPGGYNGGGIGTGGDCETYTNRYGASGGGATSITTIAKPLNELNESTDKSKVVIVAGGGGGAFNISDWVYGVGAHAGGFTGNSSTHNSNGPSTLYATGGTQSSGGSAGNSYDSDFSRYGAEYPAMMAGRFGQGGRTDNLDSGCGQGGGGGGGYYGGGSGHQTSGAGGSGYIGYDKLKNKVMYCYNCAASSVESTKTVSTTCSSDTPTVNCSKKGNGYAKVSLLYKNSDVKEFKNKFNAYKRVEYVQSNGSQYVLTNVAPTNTTGIKAKVLSTNTSNDLIYFGVKASGNRFWVGNMKNTVLYFGINGGYSDQATIAANQVYEIKMNYKNDRKFAVDDNVVQSSMPTFTGNSTKLSIFAGSVDGSISNRSSIKLYDFEITNNSDVVAHYLPCYRTSDSKPGLCDMVSGNFVTTPDGVTNLEKGSDLY